jgi:hypothetical protein
VHRFLTLKCQELLKESQKILDTLQKAPH